jgi:hypothetical protein
VVVAASILGQGFHFGFSDTDAQWGKIHSLFFELNTYSINLSQNECLLQKYLVSKLVHKYFPTLMISLTALCCNYLGSKDELNA